MKASQFHLHFWVPDSQQSAVALLSGVSYTPQRTKLYVLLSSVLGNATTGGRICCWPKPPHGFFLKTPIASLNPAISTSHYWHLGPDSSLLSGTALCSTRCSAASPAATHWMLVTVPPPKLWQPTVSLDTAKSPNVPWVGQGDRPSWEPLT